MGAQRAAKELFLECCDLERSERAAFLLERCGEDLELREHVEGMFAFEERRPEFLAGKAANLLRTSKSDLPEAIGPFRIRRKLGEGGMGTVFEADQESPRRTVALKVLSSLHRSPDALRRFEHESEFLARLQHPGIAQVYGSGTAETEIGPLPYFAMELVRGEPLNRYANRCGLSDRERLELIAQVADAVQHAHHHGVIHRDLKPQNILVDEAGQPKVLDFGIARATDSDVQLTTLHTDVGQVIGTLAYMSPEQASGDPRAIDTRSDVYSLGVLLYELLADRLPHDITLKGLPEAVRAIQEDEPRSLTAVNKTCRGDVETIVRTALEKEKARRYASAAALATDIRRYLSDEPITARRTSRIYTLRKFARRNRTVVIASAVVFVALAVGLVVSLKFALGEARQRRIAEPSLYRDRLAMAQLRADGGDEEAARELLDSAPMHLRGWEWDHLDQGLDRTLAHARIPGAVDAVFLDETRILAVDEACAVHIWNALTEETTLVATPGSPLRPGERPLALTEDGGLLVSYAGGELILRDPLGREPVRARPFPSPAPLRTWGTTAATADGSLIAVATEAGDIRLVDDAGSSSTVPPERLGGEVRTVAIGADGSWLGVGTSGSHHAWELPSMVVRREGWTPRMGPAAHAPEGTRVAMAVSDGTIDLWIRTFEDNYLRHLTRPALRGDRSGPYSSLSFSPCGDRLAATFPDGETWIAYATRSGRAVICSIRPGGEARVAFSPSGESLLSLGLDDGAVQLWDIRPEVAVDVLRGHGNYVYSVAFSPSGETLASGGWDDRARLWDGATGHAIVSLPNAGDVHATAFSPTGRQLACASSYAAGTGTITVWDTALGRGSDPLWAQWVEGKTCKALCFSGEGALLAAGLADGSIVIGRAPTFEDPITVQDEPHRQSSIRALAFQPDGGLLAAGSSTGGVCLWNPHTGKRVAQVQCSPLGGDLQRGVNSLSFSPDGSRLVAGLGHSIITVFQVEPLQAILDLEHPQGHRGEVFAVAYSPDGERIASGGRDGLLRLWDASTGELEAVLGGHDENAPHVYIMSLAFSPDGRRIATASGDHTVRIWDSGPAVDRWRARHSDDLRRPEAEQLVATLYDELGDGSQVAARLRTEHGQDADLLRLALREVLSREVP